MSSARSYTARDFENYFRGRMTAPEMHALEKAALDDPFLAEAMEGYRLAAGSAVTDLEELKQRLAKNLNTTSPVRSGRLVSMPWFRAAAMVLFIAGAALLVYQFAFKKNQVDQFAAKENKTTQTSAKDSLTAMPVSDTASKTVSRPGEKDEPHSGLIEITSENQGKTGDKPSKTVVSNPVSAEVIAEDVKAAAPVTEIKDQKSEAEKLDALAKQDEAKKLKELNAGAVRTYEKTETPGIASKRSGPNRQHQALNRFSGRITDQENNPLPFANITTTRYNVGTYADANGNFNLVSSDSILDVQVRSVGFESYTAQLRNDVSENRIVLEQDQQVSPIVLNTARANTVTRAGYQKVNVEEPEPQDGWENYDTYLANNLKLPEEFQRKNTYGNVQVSFEVNKNGEPINIKVEKSLCSKCDREAVRLVKEGPRWTRKNKKARAVVTIPFAHYHE